MSYRAFLVTKSEDGTFTRALVERELSELPEGEVLIDVEYSSLNYKDALSATGNPGVSRNFPHTPGIDAAGCVAQSSVDTFAVGDQVIVTGYDLGMNTAGGFAQKIQVPAAWVIKKPEGLSLRAAMTYGTAGFTAALCVHKLEAFGMTPVQGPVLVTGATGGVGSVAVSLLSKLGYHVVAVTGKADQTEFLEEIGAKDILTREQALEGSKKPLLKPVYAGVVDTVGGDLLANGIKALKYGCSLAACGLAASVEVPVTVLPFILRHVNLIGIDSVELPLDQKQQIWNKLADTWSLENLETLCVELQLEDLDAALDKILAGQMVGRGLVKINV